MTARHPALRIRCRYCGSPPGIRCVIPGTDRPLRYSIAHPTRCQDAHQPADTDAVQRTRTTR